MKSILVVAYLSFLGVPSIKTYVQPDMATCNQTAKAVFKQVRAGSVRAWCKQLEMEKKA